MQALYSETYSPLNMLMIRMREVAISSFGPLKISSTDDMRRNMTIKVEETDQRHKAYEIVYMEIAKIREEILDDLIQKLDEKGWANPTQEAINRMQGWDSEIQILEESELIPATKLGKVRHCFSWCKICIVRQSVHRRQKPKFRSMFDRFLTIEAETRLTWLDRSTKFVSVLLTRLDNRKNVRRLNMGGKTYQRSKTPDNETGS